MKQATGHFDQQKGTRFGINITGFLKEHESYLLNQLRAIDDPTTTPDPADLDALIKYHLQIIQWMQHERLIHLIVTCLAALFMLFSIILILIVDANVPSLLLMAISLVLVSAYTIHYFRLENTIQRWYTYGTELMRRTLSVKKQGRICRCHQIHPHHPHHPHHPLRPILP